VFVSGKHIPATHAKNHIPRPNVNDITTVARRSAQPPDCSNRRWGDKGTFASSSDAPPARPIYRSSSPSADNPIKCQHDWWCNRRARRLSRTVGAITTGVAYILAPRVVFIGSRAPWQDTTAHGRGNIGSIGSGGLSGCQGYLYAEQDV